MTPAHKSPCLLVEPFCGMAGLSFWLMWSKPPISWMGNKFGYAHVIADILGLSRHHPPAAYIWGDVGPNVAALACLSGARGNARDVAGWLMSRAWVHPTGENFAATKSVNREVVARDGSRHTFVAVTPKTQAASTKALPLPRAAEVAAIIRGWKDEEPRALWTRLKAAGWPSLMPPKGSRWGQPIVGRWLGPCEVREVAGLLMSSGWSFRQNPDAGFNAQKALPSVWQKPDGTEENRGCLTVEGLSARIDTLPARFPRVACYQGTATRLVEQLPADLSGVLVYADGPYHGDGSRKITGYKFGGCSREEQLALVADCHRRGARVAMSESVPLAAELRALTGDEWWAVDITEHREGQARTFGGTHEYVTLNRPPLHTRGTQQGLFGGAR